MSDTATVGGEYVGETVLAVPVREPWAPFDEARRAAFLESIRGGVRSRRQACQLLGLCRSTLNKWISRGRLVDHTDLDGEPHRKFYIELRAAEAARDARVDSILHKAALTDWRAAVALGQRQERDALANYQRRIKKAEAEIAEANARLARARAEVAERALEPVNGLLVFPSGFLEAISPSERSVVEGAMVRLGFRPASEHAIRAATEHLTDEYCEELEAFSKRWDERLAKRGTNQDDE